MREIGLTHLPCKAERGSLVRAQLHRIGAGKRGSPGEQAKPEAKRPGLLSVRWVGNVDAQLVPARYRGRIQGEATVTDSRVPGLEDSADAEEITDLARARDARVLARPTEDDHGRN